VIFLLRLDHHAVFVEGAQAELVERLGVLRLFRPWTVCEEIAGAIIGDRSDGLAGELPMNRLHVDRLALREICSGPLRIEIGFQEKDARDHEFIGLPDIDSAPAQGFGHFGRTAVDPVRYPHPARGLGDRRPRNSVRREARAEAFAM
jgi:hypothetical protein